MSRPFYVTTPIYYVNADPHIGHTYTTCLADALARHHRLRGDDTFFLTGSDEHGEKVAEAARLRGEDVAAVADHFARLFKQTWDDLGISYDRYIRTSDPDHERVVKDVLQKVYDAGEITFEEYEGDYCVGCERFLTSRDLVDGLCRDHERPPEHRSESNYFFQMGRHFAWLADHIERNPDFIRPERYRNEVLAMLREESGLGGALSISRPKSRLEWGIELPFDDRYVCYVWFDALINYVSGIGYPDAEGFDAYWSSAEHLIGKDILKPHAVFWPCMLRAIGVPPFPRQNVHGYWNVDSRKVSKSLGNMISPIAMKEKYGFEAFRYFLLREMSFGLDSNFSEALLVARINADLANNLGNLVSRTLNMTARFAGGVVPEPGGDALEERDVQKVAERAVREIDAHMADIQPHRALESLFALVDATNRYLELREPWKAAKDPALAERVRTTLYTCCESLRIVALLLWPFLPETADEMLARLGLGPASSHGTLPGAVQWGGLQAGGVTVKGEPLFPRIDPPDDDAEH